MEILGAGKVSQYIPLNTKGKLRIDNNMGMNKGDPIVLKSHLYISLSSGNYSLQLNPFAYTFEINSTFVERIRRVCGFCGLYQSLRTF